MWQLETLLKGMASSNAKKADTQLNERTQSLARTMIPSQYRDPVSKFFSKAGEKIQENWKRIWVITLWILANIALFAWKFDEFSKSPNFKIMGYCVCMAKGAAETLKLNMALILFPVCRRSLTVLRETFLGKVCWNCQLWYNVEIFLCNVNRNYKNCRFCIWHNLVEIWIFLNSRIYRKKDWK